MLEPEAILTEQLGPNEQLLWAGRARSGFLLRPGYKVFFFFGVLWCGMVVAAMFWAMFGAPPPREQLQIGLGATLAILFPMLLIGVLFFLLPFLMDWRRRRNTIYGVTSERALVVTSLSRKLVRSIHLEALGEMTFDEGKNGAGRIFFGPVPLGYGFQAAFAWFGYAGEGPAHLELATSAREVYDIILGARRSLRRAT